MAITLISCSVHIRFHHRILTFLRLKHTKNLNQLVGHTFREQILEFLADTCPRIFIELLTRDEKK